MGKEQFNIGDVFDYGLIKLICVEQNMEGCKGCVFNGIIKWCDVNYIGCCRDYIRKDHKNVIFKRYEL